MTNPRAVPVRRLAFALALLVTGCERSPEAAPEPPRRAVRVEAVTRGPVAPPILATGVASRRDETRLAFKLGGVIDRLEVREGERIRAGQRLAQLETTEIDAGVAEARAALAKAERDLARGRALHADDVVTREQLDDLGTAAAVARARVEAAGYNRARAELRAPADGRVLRRLAEPRELVAAGSPVLIVASDTGGSVLDVGLPDRDAVRVAIGDPAEVRFAALPGRVFAARVRELAGAADPRSGTWRCELALDADDALPAALTGLIGEARIAPASAGAQSRSYLPLAALIEGDQARVRLFRYAPDTGRVHSIERAVAFISGDRAALDEPLPDGSLVVTEGAAFLRDGEVVQLDTTEARATTAADTGIDADTGPAEATP